MDEPIAGLGPTERNRFLDLLSETGEMKGKVCRTKTAKAALSQLRQQYKVISAKLVAGQPVVRVFGEEPINHVFYPVGPPWRACASTAWRRASGRRWPRASP